MVFGLQKLYNKFQISLSIVKNRCIGYLRTLLESLLSCGMNFAREFNNHDTCLTLDSSVWKNGKSEAVPVEESLERARVGEGPAVDEEDGLLPPGPPRPPAVLHLAGLLDAQMPAVVRVLLTVKGRTRRISAMEWLREYAPRSQNDVGFMRFMQPGN